MAVRAYGKFTNDPGLQAIRKLKVCDDDVRKSILSVDEINQLLALPCDQAKCPERYDYFTFIFEILSRTGMRPAEILRTKVSHCNLGLMTFDLPGEITKTNHARSIPIPRELIPKIQQHIKYLHTNNLLFSKLNGNPFSTEDVSFQFRKRVRRLGIKRWVTLYSLRHSTATRALHNSDLLTTQALLGHRNLEVTQKYIHLDIENVRDVLDRDELVQGNMPVSEIFKKIIEFVKKLVGKDSRLKMEVLETDDELIIKVKKNTK